MKNYFCKKNMGKRTAAVIAAVIMMGFSLSLLVNIDMGTDPCTSMNLGISNRLGISLGNWQVLFNLVLLGIIIRYDRTKIGIGTLANMILVGYSMDFFRWFWNRTLPMSMFQLLAVRIGILIPVLSIFIIAAAVYMAVDLGTAPYDAIPFIIAAKQKKIPFKLVRCCWDIAAAFLGYLLGSRVGMITVIMAFALGPVIAVVQKKMCGFLGKEESHSGIS
ncbi:YczE/YyaS/YitT family protein [Anaeromicropila populeti]|uniref:Uncharacterized membrane protein YczE n=1 Tax=Anaeromicropila populeti TaxID=37658 RepID=A0A1I6J0F1_9FIRM|nr:hypothetical protein [Anaeromicropila populeti]SFR72492.1 Uncharacterized membrane protein YczE [Anaeromicropila populeti]